MHPPCFASQPPPHVDRPSPMPCSHGVQAPRHRPQSLCINGLHIEWKTALGAEKANPDAQLHAARD
jgi:hypothetical protein